ncbi:MAG: GNAT family N-acetyltransferase [Pseudomonadales bacterium]|nr:GNAT family N-acetyltransferase [Pseudomonadales bacterium]
MRTAAGLTPGLSPALVAHAYLQPRNGFVLGAVAGEDSALIGYVHGNRVIREVTATASCADDSTEGADLPAAECLLWGLYVAPLDRRSGVGRQLLQGFEEEARSLGYDRIMLDVEAHNHAALSLYLRQGYKRDAGGDKLIRMVRPLTPVGAGLP